MLGYPWRECLAGAFLRATAQDTNQPFPITLAELNGSVGYVVYQPDRPDNPATPVLVDTYPALRFLENGVRHGTGACRATD